MAAESGTSDLAVVPGVVALRLRREPYCFEFFQAVQLLERISPERTSVGLFARPEGESVRFGAHPSLSFPASQIQSLTFADQGPPLMRVNFMGVFGPLGVLPIYYTDLIERRSALGDTALRDFLDLFNHRFISLFYRAWQKYRMSALHGRGELDRPRVYLLNLVGLGDAELQDRQEVSDEALLRYTGLIAQQPRSVDACEHMLEDYFNVPVHIEQFCGAWYRIDSGMQTQFRDVDDISEALGGGAVIGDEVWEPQARMRIVLGPLTLQHYRDFLPIGSAHRPLRTLVRFFAGDAFDFDLQLILKRDEVPRCNLGAEENEAPMLGWLTWAKNLPMQRDPSETILPL